MSDLVNFTNCGYCHTDNEGFVRLPLEKHAHAYIWRSSVGKYGIELRAGGWTGRVEIPNNSGLQKCPFCGGEARLIRNARRKIYGKDEYRVGVVACCNVCEARMFYGSEKLAIEAWNRRAK